MLTLLGEKAFDIGLRKDGKDGFAVGRVVDVGTGKELVDQLLHLIVGEDLAIGDGNALSEGEGNVFVYSSC